MSFSNFYKAVKVIDFVLINTFPRLLCQFFLPFLLNFFSSRNQEIKNCKWVFEMHLTNGEYFALILWVIFKCCRLEQVNPLLNIPLEASSYVRMLNIKRFSHRTISTTVRTCQGKWTSPYLRGLDSLTDMSGYFYLTQWKLRMINRLAIYSWNKLKKMLQRKKQLSN